MRSSTLTTTTTYTRTTPLFLRHRFALPNLFPPNSFFRSKTTSTRSLRVSSSDARVDLSWQSPTPLPDDDDFNGWAVVHSPLPPKKSTGSAAILIGGTCLAAVLSAVAFFSLSRKGFRLGIPDFHECISLDRARITYGSGPGVVADEESVSSESFGSVSTEKVELARVSVPVDSAQLEVFSVLKKLKDYHSHSEIMYFLVGVPVFSSERVVIVIKLYRSLKMT